MNRSRSDWDEGVGGALHWLYMAWPLIYRPVAAWIHVNTQHCFRSKLLKGERYEKLAVLHVFFRICVNFELASKQEAYPSALRLLLLFRVKRPAFAVLRKRPCHHVLVWLVNRLPEVLGQTTVPTRAHSSSFFMHCFSRSVRTSVCTFDLMLLGIIR